MILGAVLTPFHQESCKPWFSCTKCIGLANQQSLVLIDELGRGTSPREGVGISHAIAEGLIALKVLVIRLPLGLGYSDNFLAFCFLCNVYEHPSRGISNILTDHLAISAS